MQFVVHLLGQLTATMNLKLPSTVQQIVEGEKTIFFNPDIPSWVVTDHNGALLLSLCNGTQTKEEIINLFNKVKYPYNVNHLTQEKALEMLESPYEVEKWVKTLLVERGRMMEAFQLLPICEKVYPTDANFFLAKMTDADGIYRYLVENGIIVRNRNRVSLCGNCLRITIGTKNENSQLLGALRRM